MAAGTAVIGARAAFVLLVAEGTFHGAVAAAVLVFRDDLAQAIQEVNGGRLADRALVATANVDANQQAIEITGQGSTVVLMGLAGPNDAVSVSLLSNLTQDKTIRFSWLYPLQWPTTIRLLEGQKVDTGPIITHSASLEGIGAAIERVLQREDEVIKTVITP